MLENINQGMYDLIMQKHKLSMDQFDVDDADKGLFEIILERANKVKIEYKSMKNNPKIAFRDERLKRLFHRFCYLVGGFYIQEWK